MTTAIILLSFACGIAVRHFAPAAWVAGKRWVGRTFFGVGIE